jgi:hypothetical protein
MRHPLFLGLTLLAVGACAHNKYLPGTSVPDTPANREILDTIEKYRERLAARNVEGLLVLASKKYEEDSGTPRADDDYGYEGLKEVLGERLGRLKNIRYEVQYREVRLMPNRAEVDVYIDGSFEIGTDSGDRYRRVADHHRFVMVKEGDNWLFRSGM